MLPYFTMGDAPAPDGSVFHHMATPLVEVFSVWIDNDVDDNKYVKPRKIFGQVKVFDGFGDRFMLYDREYERFETVSGRALSLRNPRCDDASNDDGFMGMSPTSNVSITVDLRDASRDEIVQGTLTTFYESPDCYDEPCIDRFGFATVYWTTLRAAVLAVVSISYVGEKSDRGVYGSLFAQYGKEYGRFCKPDEEKYFRITLFDEPRHEPTVAGIQSGACLPLTRSVLAVPAHSSIVIEGCLWDELDIMAEFAAQTCGDSSLVIENRIKVEVEFKTGQTLFQDNLGAAAS